MVNRPAFAPLLRCAAALLMLAWLLVAAQPSRAAFPGGNGKIAFVYFPGDFNSPGHIESISADGSSPADLSAAGGGASSFDAQPSWSADGKKLVFQRAANTPTGQIYVMNADGSGQTNLSNNAFNDGNPAWSPDGSKIVFRSNASGSGTQIWVMNADGSGRTQLTSGSGDTLPTFSADGTKILYTSGNPQFRKNGPIMVMNADGTDQHQVGAVTGIRADWYPDGSKLAVAVNNTTSGKDEIHVVNIDGSGDHAVAASSITDYDAPAWSPDGSQIAFSASGTGGATFTEVGVVNIDGSNLHLITGDLTTGPNTGTKPDWQAVAPAPATATITGTAMNGQVLTAQPAAGSPGTTSTLQWLTCDAAGNGCTPVTGATTTTYTLTSADIGHAFRVRETVASAAGSTPSDSAPTAAVAPNPAACSNVFTGIAGNDTFPGTTGGDQISGLGGNDVLSGGAGDDCLFGGNGNDRLSGGAGNDKLFGGNGKDSLSGGNGNDTLTGGAGNDKLSGGNGNDSLSGGSGNDTISTGKGANTVSGGAGNDKINAVNRKRDRINCGSGKHDVVHADRKDRVRGCERVLLGR